jgi:DnaJ domain
MDTLQYCSCGDLADGEGTRCARCCALEVLELKSDASENEIKEAYRVLVKVWHPDRFQADKKLRAAAEEKLKALNTAYVFLTEKKSTAKPRPAAGRTYRTESRSGSRSEPQREPRTARAAPRQPRMARRRWKLIPSPAVLVSLCALACGVLIVVLVLQSFDSTLASDPTVGRIYLEVRDGVTGRFRQAMDGIWSGAGQRVHDLVPHRNEPVAAATPPVSGETQLASQTDTVPQSAHRRELGAAQAAPAKLMPYITVGLTKDEVTAIEGAPTASTDSKLVYQGSEIDFTAGKVSGWKIDPASAPIRVKLWPDAPVDPDLDSFGVGSSKNVVLVVQGTPTYFSENEFRYGGSAVFFQNGRVVGWKDDPASAPLRTAPRY